MKAMMLTLLAFIIIPSTITIIFADDSISISSSCNDKDVNGLYYIKPTTEGEIIPVICNDGYTMLDMSLNQDQLETYFTSFYQYGDDHQVMYGPDCGDMTGWRDWFIPANTNTAFRVAIGCDECQSGGYYGDNTAYYMTSGYFCPVNIDNDGCQDGLFSGHDIQFLSKNPMCNICDDDMGLCGSANGRGGEANGNWCDCYTLQLTSDHSTDSDEYCIGGLNWRPNVVADRSQCTCYKPADSENTVYTKDISLDDLPLVSETYKAEIEASGLFIDDLIQWAPIEEDEDVDVCHRKQIYLNNDDFKHGTYRISECGNYILTEDILLNFNKPLRKFSYEDGDSPNAYNLENLHWFPTVEQQESGEYFGLDAFWGPFSIGFFAGITIETNHVYINLNGFSIGMDPEFYLQQRFFAIIELGNKQFEARQGPVDFGRDDIEIKDISITNGILGLTSHHGIHGLNAVQVVVKDLHIRDFDVGGIQCNGCMHVHIEDTEIGPQNLNIPVMGRYTHARAILSRLRYLVDEHGDERIGFANRDYTEVKPPTVKEMADKFVEQMDMIYYHITQGIEFDEQDAQWIAAKKTFLNPTGWLDGASSYGILLNGQGTAVVNIGRRLEHTLDVTIRNVDIHDLKLMPHENFWLSISEEGMGSAIVHGFFFETLAWNYGPIYDEESGIYLGDAYTDLLFAANRFLRYEYCPLGTLFYLDGLRDWVFVDGKDLFDGDIKLEFLCGSDIQSHSGKGAMGIRMDGTQNFVIENVRIRNLVNWGDLGSSMCGEYEEIEFDTGVDIDKDIQYGYTGNNVHGILADYAGGVFKDVTVENLKSWYGSTHGIAVYKGSNARFDGRVNINNLVAGSKLTQKETDALILPNAKPFVCSIFIGPNSDEDTNPDVTPIVNVGDEFEVDITDQVYGYDFCSGPSRVGQMNLPLSPELLLSEPDHHEMMLDLTGFGNVIDESKKNNHIKNVVVSLLILLAFSIVTVMALCAKRKICDNNNYNNKERMMLFDKSNNYGSI